ncbi:IS110-like element IS117 family transposase [Actinomadura nitritigenes]|uniref:IS110 family transposase n=1 Tax=Actinomadura nitritigenes TaxID=134602 RepID=UPI0027DC9F9A|nr:IS110 family transposase [Actinomadura nitritigenes]
MKITCGIDWAENHHDVVLVDQNGTLVAKRRIAETVDGFNELLTMLAEAGDGAGESIPVAIETPRGLLVAALRATGRKVYSINPMAVARYRERYSFSGKKSDHADAMVLANILRTDAHVHRPLPADTELVRSIAVLARACQDATWRRTRASNEMRSLLREYYPAMLEIAAARKGNLTSAVVRAVLQLARYPAAAAKLTKTQIAAALRRAGRVRGVEELAAEIKEVLRRPQLRHAPMVEEAMGAQALRLLATLNIECDSVDELAEAALAGFQKHPDYEVITSFPGLGDLSGARVLAELGDDRDRFTNARCLKAYAGSAPVTRASGRSQLITHRRVKNDRLAGAGFTWAFAALRSSPGARAHYDRRRSTGDRHAAALRHLFNRFLGCLYHCLQTRQCYSESAAFGTQLEAAA